MLQLPGPWPGQEPIRFCVDPSIEAYRPLVVTAFWRWRGVIRGQGEETRECAANRVITYRLQDFSGPLGFALYPVPFHPEPWAGDIFLSARADWSRQADLMLAVLLHETGHAFGLGESDEPDDLTNPRFSFPLRTVPSARELRWMRCNYDGVCY